MKETRNSVQIPL